MWDVLAAHAPRGAVWRLWEATSPHAETCESCVCACEAHETVRCEPLFWGAQVAFWYAQFSFLLIVFSTIAFCLETEMDCRMTKEWPFLSDAMSEAGNVSCTGEVQAKCCEWERLWGTFETVVVICFSVEFVLRLCCTPRVATFCVSFVNWVDFVAVLPFYAGLVVEAESLGALSVVRVVRMVRIFRVFKMGGSAQSIHLLAETMQQSVKVSPNVAYPNVAYPKCCLHSAPRSQLRCTHALGITSAVCPGRHRELRPRPHFCTCLRQAECPRRVRRRAAARLQGVSACARPHALPRPRLQVLGVLCFTTAIATVVFSSLVFFAESTVPLEENPQATTRHEHFLAPCECFFWGHAPRCHRQPRRTSPVSRVRLPPARRLRSKMLP